MYLRLRRFEDNGIQTRGVLTVHDSVLNVLLRLDTLELSWRDNARKISCIPAGIYVVAPRFSFRFGQCFALQNVLGRDGILIHKGNFNKNTSGCILVGIGWRDINDDFELDVLNSKTSMLMLLNVIKHQTTITITNDFNL